MDCKFWGSNPSKRKEFLFSKYFGTHPASYAMGTGSFSMDKMAEAKGWPLTSV
jgi:hypothetical protein